MTTNRIPCYLLLVTLMFTGGWEREQSPPSPSEKPSPGSIIPDHPKTGDSDTPHRVIIKVSRHRTLHGEIVLEDDDVIIVRTPAGVTESFAKRRILRIIRLVDPLPGQRGVVILSNGNRREGIIIEDGYDRAVLEIKGIRAIFRREIVDEVQLDPTFEEKYESFKLALVPGQPDAHFRLCQWLFDQQRYKLARIELKSLLNQNSMAKARHLLTIVDAQLGLMESRDSHPPTPSDSPASQSRLKFQENILSQNDVNLIRVYEIDFAHPPRITVRPDTIRTLLERYGDNPLVPSSQKERTALFRADPLDIVRLMFDLRARDLYSEIEVNSEPPALNLFRLRVHDSWLMNNCATSKCHGGPDAGRLFLHRRMLRDPRVRYTNFLTLERLDLGSKWPLINYQSPLDSLIIQYGLPAHEARKPHPDVHGWKPIFVGAGTQMKEDTIKWINSMMKPRPEYPIKFHSSVPMNVESEIIPNQPPDSPPSEIQP